ncbi:MAG: glutamine synthetase family protein [Alphaproteobacteria bacterium]|nr:glutamine synthetase family protein [Alphaproteobacteria bacterium]
MTETIRVAVSDLNGQARGKRLPAEYAGKLASGAVRMPLSALNVDISGSDIEDSPLVFESGDADGLLLPTERGPVAMPWLETPSELYPMAMYTDPETPFSGDPRHALAGVLARFAARGWSVAAATELEFYLVDDSGTAPKAPIPPDANARLFGDAILSLAELDAFDAYFTDLYAAAAEMGIPAQAAIAEAGKGQFEINLNHQDAMRAADDAWLFKMLVKGLARKHGLAATFLAKPFEESAGNGMHVHFSVADAEGRNVFDDGTEGGTPVLHHAVAGCLAAMADSTLLFAPHGPSYDRYVEGAHAPTGICWGYENRTAAIRIPGGPTAARRIEHRVAGADVNPYLLLAGILGAAMNGIEDGKDPPEPITGSAYDLKLPTLAPDWETALQRFETSAAIARILPADLIANLAMTKRQERARFADLDPKDMTRLYLETV